MVFFPWGNAVNWQEAEKPIVWLGDVTGRYKSRNLGSGYMVLTNQRVLFLNKSGIIGNKFFPAFGIEVSDFLSAQTSEAFTSTSFFFRSLGLHHELEVRHQKHGKNEIESFVGSVKSVSLERRASLQGQSEREPGENQIPFIREREIHHVIVKIPCRYCGVLNDQLRNKCESCGAALR